MTLVIFIVEEIFAWYSNQRLDEVKKQYFNTIKSSKYISWQNKVLSTLYGNDSFRKLFSKNYPACCFKVANSVKYPFIKFGFIENYELPQIKENKQQRLYIKMLRNVIKRPLVKGYAMQQLYLNENNEIVNFKASICNYHQNIVTSHILEYELYQLYINYPNFPTDDAKKLLQHLKHRQAIHSDKTNLQDLMIKTAENFFPLIGVQAFLVFKDYSHSENPEWKVIIIKRSEDVAIKPGYFQFIPSGGFEAFAQQGLNDSWVLKNEFNLEKAIYRELAEEVYGKEECQHNENGYDSDSIIFDQQIIALVRQAIAKQTASFDCVGIVIDLVTLRAEMSFLIIIDEPQFSSQARLGSIESSLISSIRISEIQSRIADSPLNPSSAGLFKLVIDSNLLHKLNI